MAAPISTVVAPIAPTDALRLARTLSGGDLLRARLEAACAELEALAEEIVAKLDALQSDPDLEEGCDDDVNVSLSRVAGVWIDDCEEDRSDAEEDDPPEAECEDEGGQCEDEGHDSDTELVSEDEGEPEHSVCGWRSGEVDQTRHGAGGASYQDRGDLLPWFAPP